jgi:hypothetical protein
MGGDRIIEMTWRCSGCKRQNLGRYKHCQGCGNPKDASEEFEMPSDTTLAPTVTDPKLLRLATAGPDWRCRFCGSDQRRGDDSCGNCGALSAAQPEIRTAVAAPPRRKSRGLFLLLFIVGMSCCCANCFLTGITWLGRAVSGDRSYSATVTTATWEHVIDVERYAQRTHEGFKEAIPADATDVKRIGKRVHHHDKVQSGFTTQSFVDEVPDGTRTERYTVREACGEDCTTEPQKCREVCTSNRNGFATCREECSGGRRRCKTRYCSETRTREVPKTRSQMRTITVPAYRDEPRYADAFSYRQWSWAQDRTERKDGALGAAGDDVERGTGKLPWPIGARSTGLPPGEQEREKRTARYLVTVRYAGDMIRLQVSSPEAFARFPPGSEHTLVIESGTYALSGMPVTVVQRSP